MKKKIKKKHKRIIIISIALILILLFIAVIRNNNNHDEKEYSSLKDLLEKFECIYLKETTSKHENIKTDIYLKFGKDLYTKQQSNERYFVDLIQTVAKYELYENFRMVDEEKQIEIIAMANEDKTMLTRIYINGDGNYFGNNNSKTALVNQKENKITNMKIKSNIIKELIEKQWRRKSVDFGTRQTIYEDYWIYFDEGIEVRTIAAKVYNIVFKEKYKEQILEGITTNMTQDSIIKILGEPTFGKKGDEVIGYKGNEIYIFFSESGISIYPIIEYESDSLINVLTNITETMTVKEVLDKITNIWNDYDKYEYSDSNYICLRYSLKGLQMQFNMTSNNGAVFYNNYTGNFGQALTKENLQEDNSKIPSKFYFEDEDLVYISELERYDEYKLIHSTAGYRNLDIKQQTEEFYITLEKKDNIQKNLRVISKTEEYADSDVELDSQIVSFLWIDSDTLAYCVKSKGIYLYDAKKYTKKLYLETSEDCIITKFENGRLYYN